MTDQEIARKLTHIHLTLELIAFLLAVLVASQGGIALIVGGSAIVLLVVNVLARSLSTADRESATN